MSKIALVFKRYSKKNDAELNSIEHITLHDSIPMGKNLKLLQLIRIFTQVGAKSFGGQVPVHLWDSLVTRGWLSQRDYLEAVNWSQCIPGCNGTNLSSYLGWHFKGPWGAILATLALLLPGMGALLCIATLMAEMPQSQAVENVLSAVAAATVGLLLGMTWKIARFTLGHPAKVFIAAAAFLLIGVLRVPILLAIVALGIVSWSLSQIIKQGDDGHPT